jgi:hypothetical protein
VQQQRVAARDLRAGARERGVRVVEAAPHQPLGGLLAERLEHARLRRPVLHQPAQQLLFVAGAAGEHDGDGKLCQPLREVQQEAQRRLVAPVGVVDRQQRGPALGQVGHQPVQAVQQGEHVLFAPVPAGPRAVQQRFGERRGARQQALALGCRCAGHDRLEQLQRDAEGELALQLAARRRQQLHARPLGETARGGHQLRLAQARVALEHQQDPFAGAGRVERGADGLELVVALQQDGPARLARSLAHRLFPTVPRFVLLITTQCRTTHERRRSGDALAFTRRRSGPRASRAPSCHARRRRR